MRPRLRIRSGRPPDEVLQRLRAALASGDGQVTGTISGSYVVLRMAESLQHFGSPQLSFEVEPDGAGSVVEGLFMPMPAVWTAFMALYGMIVFGGFCGAVYGYAQLQVDDTPQALWSVPAALCLLGLVYAAASVGQAMGTPQMSRLEHFLRQSVQDPCPESQAGSARPV